MATLLISLPEGEQTHELTEETITIGRLPDNTIQIEDGSVSSHHAKITSLDGRFELEDLDSTNGTRVNGQRQQKAVLNDGAKLRFGQIEAIFVSDLNGESLPLPDAEEVALKVADQTKRPEDFLNSSPYGRRGGKKGGAGTLILALGILAILIGLVVAYLAWTIQPPSL